MAQPPAPPPARPPFRVLRLHGALLVSLGLAAVIALAAPHEWRWTVRLAAGWDAGVGLFLILTFLKLARTQSLDAIRARAAELDEGGALVLPLSLIAAAASVVVVISEAAAGSSGANRAVEAALTLGTVAASWLFVHVLFGLHYAHRFYAPVAKGDRGGLLFPGESEPDYWDFLHFSLIIGVASQTADVQIADRSLRRLASVHSLTAFIFNTVLVALAVNLAVSLI
ncbi:DUF1345 domain-containing protein [Brevundimonas sp. NIBR11]|uniref:DUF1345 domain-containing protein n=1 Tax=Brevundimonas sp. NIBR11 TaxID=3015999 RepID=UPI0022F11E77|nr:DUF1345 domain-containing protein [Brevundimonas sp. NIBR11]WGM32008.1 hypothetical protein KKHFBJBL_02259 [Brevundimonas sp. NIBR11]